MKARLFYIVIISLLAFGNATCYIWVQSCHLLEADGALLDIPEGHWAHSALAKLKLYRIEACILITNRNQWFTFYRHLVQSVNSCGIWSWWTNPALGSSEQLANSSHPLLSLVGESKIRPIVEQTEKWKDYVRSKKSFNSSLVAMISTLGKSLSWRWLQSFDENLMSYNGIKIPAVRIINSFWAKFDD